MEEEVEKEEEEVGTDLTHGAAPHIRTQLHVVRAGTRVLGGVVGDLGSLETQVLTAPVRQTAQVTRVRG